jgi:hypothetical protein
VERKTYPRPSEDKRQSRQEAETAKVFKFNSDLLTRIRIAKSEKTLPRRREEAKDDEEDFGMSRSKSSRLRVPSIVRFAFSSSLRAFAAEFFLRFDSGFGVSEFGFPLAPPHSQRP